MKISTVTIGKLIEAHYEKDEVKFKAYAEYIADVLKEQEDERGERIIRSRINGTYKNNPIFEESRFCLGYVSKTS